MSARTEQPRERIDRDGELRLPRVSAEPLAPAPTPAHELRVSAIVKAHEEHQAATTAMRVAFEAGSVEAYEQATARARRAFDLLRLARRAGREVSQ
jgi:hypothetical protein